MRKIMLLALAALFTLTAHAQDFPGYRTGNYTGVNGVFTNPANIADSRYYFDVNLLSVSTLGANNNASYKLKNFSETFKGENLRKKLFGEVSGPSSGLFSLDIHGPSGMIGIGTRNAIALTTRTRMFANVHDFDSKLFDHLTNGLVKDPTLPYSINTGKDMRFAINGWSEFGASFARTLIDNGAHALKGGVSLKYLAGAVNGYMNFSQFQATINADPILAFPFLENTTGRMALGFSGERVSGFEAKELFKMHGYGFGSDIGFVYEYRPEANMQTTDGIRFEDNYTSLYKFKFGVSVMDIGSILYKKDPARSADYTADITNDERLYLDELEEQDFDDYKAYFDTHPELFIRNTANDETEYNVSLPTTLQLEADYLMSAGWYLNLSSQIALTNNNTKFFNNRAYSAVTLTPRYEDKVLGLFLPVNYNSLTKLNVGLAVRVGPLFFGSGSLFTALFGSSKQADVLFGLRLGELK